jgi:hypothetical protein
MEVNGELHALAPESPDNEPRVPSSSGYSALLYVITDNDGDVLKHLCASVFE